MRRASYTYRAVDDRGNRLTGTENAVDSAALARQLRVKGMRLVFAEHHEDGGPLRATKSARAGRNRRALADGARSLGALLAAGMPLTRALEVSAATAPVPHARVLDDVRASVQRGRPLAEALASHPSTFPAAFIGLIRAGELSGELAPAFTRMADHLEREVRYRSRLISLSIYPALLAVVGLGAVVLLTVFVLPRFAEMLEGPGVQLPVTTAVVLGLSTAVRTNIWALPVLLIASLVTFGWLRASSRGARFAAAALVRLPIVGRWRRQAVGAQFARLLGMLMSGRAPLLGALEQTGASMRDPQARADVEWIRERVRQGGSLGAALAERTLFPPLLAQLVAVGEEAGRVPEFLLNAADILEQNTERALERMVALAEPAMILVFGGMVAFVALALLQAVYGVNAGVLP
jgi:type II secretory pathway component PulF